MRAARFFTACAVLSLLLVASRRAHAQCRPQDDFSRFVLNMAVNSVTSTDPALVRERISDSLLAVSEREVVQVSDSATCRKALDAYNEALGSRGRGPTASTEVIVVGVGRDRYMVSDPGQRCGEWIYTMIMNGDFNVLRVIAT